MLRVRDEAKGVSSVLSIGTAWKSSGFAKAAIPSALEELGRNRGVMSAGRGLYMELELCGEWLCGPLVS